MRNKEEILNHLASTVYSSGARKSIIGFLYGVGVNTDEVKFAKRKCSARGQENATFADFIEFAHGKEQRSLEDELHEMKVNIFKEAKSPKEIFFNFKIYRPGLEFQAGDAVKYIPTPDESSTEYVEAIAHDVDNNLVLCLSNGEWTKVHNCIKYRYQGDARRALIDELSEITNKLNEVYE